MIPHDLSAPEVRVLGALIEKEMATPEYYPLSLKSLMSACNQTTNREPIMTLHESDVSGALDSLRRRSLVRGYQPMGSRVVKYQHLLAESESLSRPELAVMCLLMLRGEQTLAELKSRAARLVADVYPDAFERALEALTSGEPSPMAARLPRKPGQKEPRYAHLLSGAPVTDADEPHIAPVSVPALPGASLTERVAVLEETVRELRSELDELRGQITAFRQQFE